MQTEPLKNEPIKDKPQPGENWNTARGSLVRIESSDDQNIVQARYLDIRAGGRIPVQFDLDGKKIGGRADWLVERES